MFKNQKQTKMKKAFAMFLISCTLIISCSEKKSDDKMSDQAARNLEISRTISAAFGSGDVSKIDSIVSPDFVDHTDRGDMGRDSLKAMITVMHSINKDMKMEVIREFANDEYVYSHLRFTGTSDGSMGMPVGAYDMNEIEVIRFKDGKCVEHWAYMEPREMMKMMPGMLPPAKNPADSTK